jgi:hypothetical protein
MPLPDKVAADKASPVSESVGLPAMPSPFATLKPAVPAAIERLTTVFTPDLTIKPVAAFSRLADVPFKNRL